MKNVPVELYYHLAGVRWWDVARRAVGQEVCFRCREWMTRRWLLRMDVGRICGPCFVRHYRVVSRWYFFRDRHNGLVFAMHRARLSYDLNKQFGAVCGMWRAPVGGGL